MRTGSEEQRFAWMQAELQQLEQAGQYRQLVQTELLQDGWLLRDGHKMLNLASNDYLGLSSELMPERITSAYEGASASRLIVGHSAIYEQFEREFAAYKGTEACLLFSSGYMANSGVIPALASRDDIIFSDKWNHASIVDGITLSRADHRRYRHRDLAHLEKLLASAPSHKRKWIITDAVFSMDGTVAPLRELVALKERYGALLMIDEAHSGGVYGEAGQGLAHSLHLTTAIDVHMGTFSKAYGCYGAYIAGDRVLIDYLLNKARTFIYTTALPPALIETVRARWLQVKAAHSRRSELLANADRFRLRLEQAGFQIGASTSQIIPLIVGDNERAQALSNALQNAGIAAVAIRPPTVPEGTARIRFSLMSVHQRQDLDEAVQRITDIGRTMELI